MWCFQQIGSNGQPCFCLTPQLKTVWDCLFVFLWHPRLSGPYRNVQVHYRRVIINGTEYSLFKHEQFKRCIMNRFSKVHHFHVHQIKKKIATHPMMHRLASCFDKLKEFTKEMHLIQTFLHWPSCIIFFFLILRWILFPSAVIMIRT